MLSDQLV